MNSVGRIAGLWRYPVSSLGGEQLTSVALTAKGIDGDRRFALIDAESGHPAAPEKHARWRDGLHLQAQCVAGQLPTIRFPDGHRLQVDDPSLNGMLSEYFGFAVAIAANEPIEGHPGFLRTEHRHRHFPVHALTTASLQRLAEVRQVETVDVKRFRPTVLLETGAASGFAEKQWIGRSLRLGEVTVYVQEETTRCGMTFIAQPGFEDDPEILRSILRHNKRHLGINCTVDVVGILQVGDKVFVGNPPG